MLNSGKKRFEERNLVSLSTFDLLDDSFMHRCKMHLKHFSLKKEVKIGNWPKATTNIFSEKKTIKMREVLHELTGCKV